MPADYDSKLSLMTDYLRDAQYSRKYNEVPDRECRGMRLGCSGLVGCAGWLPLCNVCHLATQPCPCSPHSPRPMCCIPATASHCVPLPPLRSSAYYGGASGFELVLDLLDDACEGLLDRVNASKQQ